MLRFQTFVIVLYGKLSINKSHGHGTGKLLVYLDPQHHHAQPKMYSYPMIYHQHQTPIRLAGASPCGDSSTRTHHRLTISVSCLTKKTATLPSSISTQRIIHLPSLPGKEPLRFSIRSPHRHLDLVNHTFQHVQLRLRRRFERRVRM
jgi:hypothetical protein